MPAGWHQMIPGDPAWRDVYGEGGSPVETELERGDTAAFALPLGTPDAHLLTLVVYAVPTTEPNAVVLGLQYASVLERAHLGGDYDTATVRAEDDLALEAGAAFRVEAVYPYQGSEAPTPRLPTHDDRVLAYVLLRDGVGYYVVFRGNDSIFGAHRAEMACMADSIELFDPVPVPAGSQPRPRA